MTDPTQISSNPCLRLHGHHARPSHPHPQPETREVGLLSPLLNAVSTFPTHLEGNANSCVICLLVPPPAARMALDCVKPTQPLASVPSAPPALGTVSTFSTFWPRVRCGRLRMDTLFPVYILTFFIFFMLFSPICDVVFMSVYLLIFCHSHQNVSFTTE